MTNQKTLTLTHQFLSNLSTSTREMLIEATNNPPTQNPFQTISDFDLKQKAVAELKSNGLSFRKCSYDKKYYLRKAPPTNHAVSTLHNDIFECENIIVSIYNELKKETLSEAPVAEEAQHYAVVQRSSDTVLVVGESAAEAVREYCIEHEEATKAELLASWHSDQDVVLVPCSEFLYTKALAGDYIVYFWNEGILTCYITDVEDFDRADTTLSSEYESSSAHTTFDSYSYPVFKFKNYILEVSADYDSLLDYDDVSDITNDIEAHFSDDYSRDYDTIVFALCTESNQYPDGQFKLDGEDRYCLSFGRSDAVLILRKG